MSTLTDEIFRGRTFAIISHPSAGKTTLTEKLLLFGGTIQLAGEVRARRAAANALGLDGERARARYLGLSLGSSASRTRGSPSTCSTPRDTRISARIPAAHRPPRTAQSWALPPATRSNPGINQFQPATGKIPDVPRCQGGAAGAGDRSDALVCLGNRP